MQDIADPAVLLGIGQVSVWVACLLSWKIMERSKRGTKLQILRGAPRGMDWIEGNLAVLEGGIDTEPEMACGAEACHHTRRSALWSCGLRAILTILIWSCDCLFGPDFHRTCVCCGDELCTPCTDTRDQQISPSSNPQLLPECQGESATDQVAIHTFTGAHESCLQMLFLCCARTFLSVVSFELKLGVHGRC